MPVKILTPVPNAQNQCVNFVEIVHRQFLTDV